jgi:hypothetical protein
MKQIQVKVTGQVHVSTAGTNVTQAVALIGEARRNRLKVIEGTLSVERELETVILHYFFGDTHAKKDAFRAMILESDWCSFAAKRKLISHIIHEQNLLEGRDKTDFEKLLKDVMSFRNAFTHGKLSSDSSHVYLSYFEGTPRTQELTDAYLTRVETLLCTAHDKAFELTIKIGAIKSARCPNTNPPAAES